MAELQGANNTLFNLALLLTYDGARFNGWQKQADAVRTVQRELEAAILKFTNVSVDTVAAGRTDAKVHATYQVVNFLIPIERSLSSWVRGLNSFLPQDIAVLAAQYVPLEFNARFMASSRTYHYYLLVSPVRPVILQAKVGWYHFPLNTEAMRAAGNMLVGEQDFSSFRASGCQAATAVRTLTQFTLNKCGNMLCFSFTANAFLYHMVRNMVGALIYVGCEKLSQQQFSDLIVARDRSNAPPTFMPDGLYLTGVSYPQPLFDNYVVPSPIFQTF